MAEQVIQMQFFGRALQFSPAGTGKKEEKILVREGNNLLLKKTGKMIDLNEQIASHLDSVSLPRLLARYYAGDLGAINCVSGFYGDISDLPASTQDKIKSFQNAVRVITEFGKRVAVQRDGSKVTVSGSVPETEESEVKNDG